jgi:hypothetical protein
MKCPETAAEWWGACEAETAVLVALIYQFHPYYGREHAHMPIASAASEAISDLYRAKIRVTTEDDPVEAFRKAVPARNAEDAVNILSAAYIGMPESGYVREVPGFMLLCDLCSECYLIFPEGYEFPDDSDPEIDQAAQAILERKSRPCDSEGAMIMAKPRKPRSPASNPMRNEPQKPPAETLTATAKQVIYEAERISEVIEGLHDWQREKGEEFFDSVITKAESIIASIRRMGDATPGQAQAIANMLDGVEKWQR